MTPLPADVRERMARAAKALAHYEPDGERASFEKEMDAALRAAEEAGCKLVRVTRKERPPFVIEEDEESESRMAAQDKILDATFGPPQSIPEGWQLVPKEATAKMYEAYKRAVSQHIEALPLAERLQAKARPHGLRVQARTKFKVRWAAMLAAAPKVEGQSCG